MALNTMVRSLVLALLVLLLTSAAEAVATKKKWHRRGTPRASATVVKKSVRASSVKARKAIVSRTAAFKRRRKAYSFWTEPTYADATVGDSVEGEDPVIRRAAVEALGPYNGTVVVADPIRTAAS